jgi:hypothetical protein
MHSVFEPLARSPAHRVAPFIVGQQQHEPLRKRRRIAKPDEVARHALVDHLGARAERRQGTLMLPVPLTWR